MTFTLSQPQVLDLLAFMHGADPERPTALRGRFQAFQRLGLPTGSNTGRGKPARYGAFQILQVLIAFELLQLGLSPERIAALLSASRRNLAYALSEGLDGVDDAGTPQTLVALVRPNALVASDEDALPKLVFGLRSLMLRLLEAPDERNRRFAIIDVTATLRSAGEWLAKAEIIAVEAFDAALIVAGDDLLLPKPTGRVGKSDTQEQD